ncbi:MAG: alpha/beta fold hydrolase [Acetobacteraceae bacterium]|nr:alpha/beta fold hydrolase [Acetobacteraceae bacterium]
MMGRNALTLYALKPRFQALLRPLAAQLAVTGVTANQVTVAAAVGSVAIGLLVAVRGPEIRALFLLVPIWLLLRMALNALDGMLAREHGQRSRLGFYLNEIGDVVSDAALYAPFALLPPFGPAGVGTVILLATLSEFAGVLAAADAGGARRYDGPLGKSDRALVFGALGLWAGIAGTLPEWLSWLMPVLALLLVMTTVNRVRSGLAAGVDAAEAATVAGALPAPGGPMSRPVEESSFRTHDGVELFYRYWPAATPTPRGAVVMFHRGHEHSGRMAHLPEELDLPDFAFFAWDARGHGRSPGERGHSPSLADSVRDVQDFIEHIEHVHGIAEEDIAVLAQSVGAVLAATWAHDYAPRVRCLVLASPAFKVKLYVPFARAGLRLLRALRGNFVVNSYVKARFLTHDPVRIASYDADPLITRPISVNILLELYEAAERVVADARAIAIPTQLLISGADWVVHHGPQHRFYERLGTPIKERHVLPGFFHDTLGERDRAVALLEVRRFVLERFAEPLHRPALFDADRAGFTRDEADALASPLPALSPRGLYWAATRMGLRVGGSLSEGIALGHATGFDSGSTLDYVYRNEARGSGPLGRMLDRAYLDSLGWRGIRQRKLHVEELLREAMQRLAEEGLPVRVMDIAAGHGRYVLEALEGAPVRPDSILLRDYSELNVTAGQRLIAEKRLGEIARFVQADAFDRDGLAMVEPKPTLAVVSGLYELFAGNAMVRRSLEGLAAVVPEGGYLVYTNQPWHPQLEMIARALTSHRQGQAWIMRRRTQEEMDQLVRAAGFRKVTQRIDQWGIFTVSLAVRSAA